MEITSLKISNDKQTLELAISDAATVTNLLLFTNDTYRDFNKAIDISSKLTGSATENITITLSDAKVSYFDGLYFIQAEDSDEISTAILAELTRYKECVLDKLLELSQCDECLAKESMPIIRAESLLRGLESAVKCGYLEEAFNIVKALDKYCSNSCKSCGTYNDSNVINYFTTNSN